MLIYQKLIKENITKIKQLLPKEINDIKNEH